MPDSDSAEALITGVRYVPLQESQFVKPRRMLFNIRCRDGVVRARSWDLVHAHDAVCVLLLDTDRRAFVLVRQFRPAVYAVASEATRRADPQCGFTLELPSGLVDKRGHTLAQTARAEVLEECGYDVPLSRFRHVTDGVGSIGMSASALHVFYAEADGGMRVGAGGGLAAEGEDISVVLLPEAQAEAFLAARARGGSATGLATGLLLAFQWYFLQVERGLVSRRPVGAPGQSTPGSKL
eukprot:g5547.t1